MQTKRTPKGNRDLLRKFMDGYSIILVTLVMIVASMLLQGLLKDSWSFLTWNNIINILRNNSITGVIALGMAFVIITGNIDLSAGAQMVAVSAMSITVINWLAELMAGASPAMASLIPTILGVLTAFACSIALSVLTGIIVTKGRVPSFIVTMGMQLIYRSVLVYALNGGGVTTKVPGYLALSSTSIPLGFGELPLQILYFFIMVAVYWYISKYTSIGRRIYAVGSNEKATRLSGIKTDRIKIMAYALLGVAIAVAGVMESSRMGSINSTSSGTNYELNAIAMAVIGGVAMEGGRGRIVNTMFGAFIFGMISNILTLLGLPTKLVNAVKGAIIILAVLIQRKDKDR